MKHIGDVQEKTHKNLDMIVRTMVLLVFIRQSSNIEHKDTTTFKQITCNTPARLPYFQCRVFTAQTLIRIKICLILFSIKS